MKVLPREILMDIFAVLPIKLIGHCRCVSKSWNHFLSEPDFVRAHLDRTKINELLLLRSCPFYKSTFYTASIDCQLSVDVTMFAKELTLGVEPKFLSGDSPSCDGLILMEDNAKQTLLVNPTTKEVRVLPVPSHALKCFKRVFGLGYDHVTDDYKVVSPSYYFNKVEPTMVVHVYSVRDGKWKEVDSSLYDPCCVGKGTWKEVESFKYRLGYNLCKTGVFVGGFVNWVATNMSNCSSFIMGFNLAEEKLRVIPAPRSVFGECYVSDNVGVLGGCLCVLNLVPSIETNIWVMKEYGVEQSWTKLSIGDGIFLYSPELCISTRRELVMVMDDHTEYKDLVIYDLDSATLKGVVIHGVIQVFFGGCFRETLVSPYYNHKTYRA